MVPHGRQSQILAIDASVEILDLYAELLEDEGYRVTTMTPMALDPAAIARLGPDALIIDPFGRWGDADLAPLQQLRRDPRTGVLPIILCTGAVRQLEPLQDCLAALRVLVVPKPFDLDGLLGAVREALVVRPARRA